MERRESVDPPLWVDKFDAFHSFFLHFTEELDVWMDYYYRFLEAPIFQKNEWRELKKWLKNMLKQFLRDQLKK